MLARPLHLPLPIMLDLVSATSFLPHFYLSSMSHTSIPSPPLPLHTIYLMGPFSILAYLSSDWSLFVTRRLVFTSCILQARPQYRCTYILCCHSSHGFPTRPSEDDVSSHSPIMKSWPLSNPSNKVLFRGCTEATRWPQIRICVCVCVCG